MPQHVRTGAHVTILGVQRLMKCSMRTRRVGACHGCPWYERMGAHIPVPDAESSMTRSPACPLSSTRITKACYGARPPLYKAASALLVLAGDDH